MIKTYHKHSIGKLNMRSISRMFFANFKKRKILIFSLIALLIILPISLIVLNNKSTVEAAWMNDQWGYRQTIAITNTGSTQTNSQIKVFSNTDLSALVSAGKLQSDLDDIRFTDINGKLLKYWIEDITNNSVDIWVLIPSISTSGTTIYFYYGNSSVQAGKSVVGTQDFPGISCKAIKLSGATINNLYYIDPNGQEITDKYQVYCELTIDGGGWSTLIVNSAQNTTYDPFVDFGSVGNPQDGSYSIWSKRTQINYSEILYKPSYQSLMWASMTTAQPGYFKWTDASGNPYSRQAVYSTSIGVGRTNTYSTSCTNFTPSGAYGLVIYEQPQTWCTPNGTEVGFGLFSGDPRGCHRDGMKWSWGTTPGGNNVCPIPVEWKSGYVLIGIRETTVAITQTPSVSSPANEQKSPAPVAYWKFDEGNGVTANNSFWQKTGTTTNMELNPSLETNMNGWSGWNNSGTATRELSTEKAAFGSYSFKQTVTATGSQEGDSYGANIQEGHTYTVSFWVNAPILGSGESIPFYYRVFHNTGNYIPGTIATINTTTNGWVRYSMTQTIPVNGYTGTNIQLSFYTNSIGTVVYVDGVQIEESSSATSYCDGSLTGNGSHAWNGTAHASSSTCETGSDADLRGTSWVSEDQCISGKCQYFDGLKSYMIAPHGGTIMFKSGDFSVSIWAKPTSMTGYSGLITTDIAGDSAWKIFRDSGNSFFSARYGTNTLNFPVVNINEWHQYGYVKSGTTLTLYLDGKQVNQGSVPATHSVDGTELAFGSYRINDAKNGNYIFKGYMDDVKIYPYARTAAQIKSDFASKGSSSVKGTSVQMGSNTKNSDAFSNGLVGYWKMDESSWGSVIDASGNGNTGTAFGNATITAGKFGNGGIFDNTGDGVSIGSPASLDFGNNGPFTFAGWVKPTTLGDYDGFVSKDTASRTSPYSYMTVFMANGRLSAYNNSAWIDICPAGSIVTGNWQYVVFDYNGTNLTGYVNGVACGSAAFTYPDNAAYEVAIGSWYSPSPGSYDYNGAMDDVRIYNRALSPKEVRDLYAFAPGPLLYWKFDEKSGSAQDSSGNNYIGTITGSPTQGIVGKFGSAFTFTSGQTRVGNTSIIPPSWNNFSIMGWIKPTSSDLDSNWHDILGWRYDQNGNVNGLWIFQNKLTFWSGTGGTSQYNQTLTAGNWYHVATTFDGTTRTVYLNGVAQTFTAGFTNTTNEFYVGTAGTSPVYPSYQTTDEVKIYPYVRTSKQITEDMNAGHPVGGSPVGSQVGYWKMDEGYGDTANNSGNGGSAINGNLAGSGGSCPGAAACPTWNQNGKFEKALSFDGSNDYVDISSSNFDFAGKDFTISLWAYYYGYISHGSAWNCLVGRDDAFSITGYGICTTSTNQVQFSAGNVQVNSGVNITNGWHHIVAVHDSVTPKLRIYVDGVLKNTAIYTNQLTSKVTALAAIGEDNQGARQANSIIDEVKIYNSALTEDEIKLDYNRGSTMVLGSTSTDSSGNPGDNSSAREYCIPGDTTSCSPPVGEWKMDEKTGVSANDTSGNGYTGTLTGSPTWTLGKYGSAVNFVSNDYMNLASPYLDLVTDWTIESWFKYPFPSGACNTLTRGNGGDHQVIIDCGGSLLGTYDNVGGTGFRSSGFNTNTLSTGWHHVAAVGTGSNTLFYIDGRYVGTATYKSTSDIRSVGGYFGGGQPFGTIDQTRVYNYARTPAQIAYDYNRGAPVGHWKLDECQGITANDSSGNNNTGTITIGASGSQTAVGTCTTSGTSWYNGVTGKYNSSLNFDGSDDTVLVPYSSSLNPTNSISITAWVKPNVVTAYKEVLRQEEANRKLLSFQPEGATGTALAFGLNVGGSYTELDAPITASEWTNGSWHFITATFNGSVKKVYDNGKEIGSENISGALGAGTQPIYIGSTSGGGEFFSGQIDDVKIFNYALTGSQIKSLYNSGAAVQFAPATGSP